MKQEEHRQKLYREHFGVTARARSLSSDLADRQMTWVRAGGGWSVGQVFEHLCVANDSYLDRIRSLSTSSRGPGIDPSTKEWRPTLMGRFLVNSFRSTRKLPVPRIYKPAAIPRANVVDEFLTRQDEMTALLDKTRELDWTRLRTSSPVTFLIRVNLGDCFTIMVSHAERHLRQIERIRTQFANRPDSGMR